MRPPPDGRPSPPFDLFASRYAAGRSQVLAARIVADLETPVSAMLMLAEGRPNSFLLESVEGGAVRGRYSMIGMKPDLIWRCLDGRAEINRRCQQHRDAFEADEREAFDSLRAILAESRIELDEDLPPMAAGLFGFLSYDMVRLMERLPNANPDPLELPDAVLLRPTVVAVFDNVEDLVTIVTPVWPDAEISAETAYALAGERLANVIADFDRSVPHRAVPGAPRTTPARANMSRTDFEAAVERAKEYIRAGDIFQVVPSQRFELPFELPAFALYRSLRRLNPSPFLFYLNFDGYSLVGSSPEILVRLRNGVVTLRPLAGTRPRGLDRQDDERLAAEMLADPKELAEHLMLLDLGRNDVGRVAEIGSVFVSEKMVVEYYSHVMHIVSNVEGRLAPDMDAVDALIAGFPAGTVSGAPKVRAMEIIDELEPVQRRFYAGAIGYFGADGNMDTCIALRTALVKDAKMYVQAGGGVVADSDPGLEYQESLNKAQALIRAAAEAPGFVNVR
ncbi:MAG: anthranilate synthase component I [Geminicoccaceae bacterium]